MCCDIRTKLELSIPRFEYRPILIYITHILLDFKVLNTPYNISLITNIILYFWQKAPNIIDSNPKLIVDTDTDSDI